MAAATLRGALAASGMTHAQLAERLGTSRPRVTSYTTGTMIPSADLLIEALSETGAMRIREHAQGADSTAARINSSAGTAEKFRWLLEGRDYLHSASPIEALAKWGRITERVDDRRWMTLLAALTRPEFERMNMTPPEWTDMAPLDEPWQPDDLPVREESLEPQLLTWNIRVRTKDLVTL